MWLTNLADIARAAGLNVLEVPGWEKRGHGPLSAVKGVVCHHTAGPADGDAPSLNVITNGRPGLTGPLSNFLLARSGTVYVVAAGKCYHSGVVFSDQFANENTIGIEAEATGKDAWPDVQMDAYERLCAALVEAFELTVSTVQGHKEVAKPLGRNIDPNFDMDAFRADVQAILDTDTPSAPEKPKVPRFPLSRGSYFGPKEGPAASVSGYYSHREDLARWQGRMRDRGWQIDADGLYGPQTADVVKAFQAEKNLTVDGLIGPQTWRAAWTAPVT